MGGGEVSCTAAISREFSEFIRWRTRRTIRIMQVGAAVILVSQVATIILILTQV